MAGLRARVRRAVAAVVAGATTLALLAAPPAAAQGEELLRADFSDGMAGWRAVTGSLSEWTTADGHATVDTRGQTSGRYLTVDPRLDLPESYEVSARVRVAATSGASSRPVNLITDWADPADLRAANLAAQVLPGGEIMVARPLATTTVCSGPGPLVVPGDWFDLTVRRARGVVVVEIAGERVASVAARDGSGTIGLGVYLAKISIDSLVVRTLPQIPADHPTQPAGCSWSAGGKLVMVNQSGYDLEGPKRFTAPKAADGTGFTVVDEGGAVRFSGAVRGGVGDFTAFRPADAGPYRVVVEGSGTSFNFGVGPAWTFRVAYRRAIEFMSGTRCYFGDAGVSWAGFNASQCGWSVMWRDGDTYSFEIPTLVDLYAANPSAFEGLRIDTAVYKGLRHPLPADAPEIVRLIAWGAEMLLDARVTTTLWKEQLAAFLAAYPDLSPWVPRALYEEVRDYLFPIWGQQQRDRFNSVYDYTAHTGDLFQTYTQLGTGKGEFPPGHSIRPNLDMYEVALREGRADAGRYLAAAAANARWIVENLDWADPRTTKGQRQSEHITVPSLVRFLTEYPGDAPDGLQAKIEAWARTAADRSGNLWDFRKYSADRWTIPSFSGGGAGTDPNETGNVAGFAAPALAAAGVVRDAGLAARLREIAAAHVDNIFGRNPTGRHATYRATTERWGFEGADLGWFSEYQGGVGMLQGVPGVLDGSPKNGHYPFDPTVGNIGHTEGWVSFNTAWNASLAWLAADRTAVRLLDSAGAPITRAQPDSPVTVELTAPLNLAAGALDSAKVEVRVGDEVVEVAVKETAQDATTFRGVITPAQLGAAPGEVLVASYGHGDFARSARAPVTACAKDPEDTVVVAGADTGVPNAEDAQGCSVAQRLGLDRTWPDHGSLVSYVARESRGLVGEALLTAAQRATLISTVARS
ncbi:hypothetical protein GCM10010404_53710 [Nonomuraea africana]|uniref:Alpha-L-rhamnosidase six-hairpin glycosidase domain-containing protein n=1 Tax=Nonomuraea africana TaxID=46171 RepID=A0ABR9K5L3_9ACTN|nr:hypothetical protein [Nonomuraea africana]MBE1557298.1 hypothetical protein [Nonomuraea africana]